MRWTCTHLPLATDFNRAQKINLLCCQDPISALTRFFWHLFKSEHVRLVQYRAHARQDKGEEHGPNPPNGSWGDSGSDHAFVGWTLTIPQLPLGGFAESSSLILAHMVPRA